LYEVYPDELFQLTTAISRRQTDNMLAQLRIVTNPHLEPADRKALVDELMERRRVLYGGSAIDDSKFDKEGFEALRQDLGRGSKSIGVKL
jgi:hypothetical protein